MIRENIVAPDFRPRRHLKMVAKYRGIYQYPGEAGFYIRPIVKGRRITHKLRSTTVSAAERERGRLISQLAQFHAGLARNPFAVEGGNSLARLIDFYRARGCPRKKAGKQRQGDELQAELRRCQILAAWPGAKRSITDASAEWWRKYRDWRLRHSIRRGVVVTVTRKPGDGLRAVDKERITVSNVMRCAIGARTETGIERNPAGDLEIFKDPDAIVHCRDHMPRSGDELHAIAREFFSSGPRRHVFGWLVLLSARIGHRSHEMIRLRTDAAGREAPGFVAGRKLYLYRSETSKGTYGHVEIDRDFQACLDAHRAWLAKYHPHSPWYFPSPEDSRNTVHRTSLTHALAKIAPSLQLPHRTAHGLRAFRVNVLRSEGKSLDEAALLVGQKSRGKLIVDVYGEGLDYKLEWMPTNGAPAWEIFNDGDKLIQGELRF